jgi:hypothetical protein
MGEVNRFGVWSLVAVVLINGLLLGAFYYLTRAVLVDQQQWLILAGIWLGGSLILWAVLRWLAGRMAETLQSAAPPAPAPAVTPVAASPALRPVAPPPAAKPQIPPEAGAVQMLAVLQRQGRLIDFLQEDLALYADDQIGAAVRSIHAGCKQALAEHVQMEPVYKEAEGSAVVVQPGFDAYSVRLSGDVTGEPPFRGTLRHRGWRVTRVDLPVQADAARRELVVAPAEVEV